MLRYVAGFHEVITARKRSLRSLCFYSHSVHGGGGVSASVHAGIHPPRSRHPPRKQTPAPGSRHCAVHTRRYGQQAGGTHPTGMHTCFLLFFVEILNARRLHLEV